MPVCEGFSFFTLSFGYSPYITVFSPHAPKITFPFLVSPLKTDCFIIEKPQSYYLHRRSTDWFLYHENIDLRKLLRARITTCSAVTFGKGIFSIVVMTSFKCINIPLLADTKPPLYFIEFLRFHISNTYFDLNCWV